MLRRGWIDGRQAMIAASVLYGLLRPGLVVMDVLDFFESLQFRGTVAQILSDLATSLVDAFVLALGNQFFSVA
jgi:hypothetical protein